METEKSKFWKQNFDYLYTFFIITVYRLSLQLVSLIYTEVRESRCAGSVARLGDFFKCFTFFIQQSLYLFPTIFSFFFYSEYVYIMYSIQTFELCSYPLTWFKPFNVSLCLNLFGLIKTYFQPHFVLQHSAGNAFSSLICFLCPGTYQEQTQSQSHLRKGALALKVIN